MQDEEINMGFEEWEKENAAKLCPHAIKTYPEITVTRCRKCIWEAARKEMAIAYLKEIEGGKVFGITIEGRLKAVEHWLRDEAEGRCFHV